MPSLFKTFNINRNDFIHAGDASIHVKKLLKNLNISPDLIRRVAICGYEGEMNVVMHGGAGIFSVEIGKDEVVLTIDDDGPGIPNIRKAMKKGFSTASPEHRKMGYGSGMGLSNMNEFSDELLIGSEPGYGVSVRMSFNISGKGREEISR